MTPPRSNATAIVEAILRDLRGRRGLRQEWDAIDAEMQEEIREEWVQIVHEAATPLLREAHSIIGRAEEWAEEIQHSGYAVPRRRASEFSAFWDELESFERKMAEYIYR